MTHPSALLGVWQRKHLELQLHSSRLVPLVHDLCVACGISKDDTDVGMVGAYFHDVGKVHVPDEILHKPGPLSEAEWSYIKDHPVKGEEIIRQLGFGHEEQIAGIVRSHHERFGGGGYPDGLEGEEIPILARIMAIADNYDSITIKRPYKRGHNHASTIEIMKQGRGTFFDPVLFDIFLEYIETSPIRVP